MDDFFEDVEQTLLVVRECFVYRIPPRTSAAAVRCSDWGLDQPLWKGRLRILSKGPKCTIFLEDTNTGELFAQCNVDQNQAEAVESVSDSSRYFVLRITNSSGQNAYIGMGFRERSESFDFNVALQEHAKQLSYAKQQKEKVDEPAKPSVDYSLGAASITLSIKGVCETMCK
eukprot:TRINITY_DN3236_c0_g2_i2.p1 TRINITY_DN3236_c0_g2~~TRINITY_DN3236_c0_g2_i2.p1  ORF type:complete len:172 (-),score=41.82 TRINITY_DN3236_c0_g2_i2:414-929(-)